MSEVSVKEGSRTLKGYWGGKLKKKKRTSGAKRILKKSCRRA